MVRDTEGLFKNKIIDSFYIIKFKAKTLDGILLEPTSLYYQEDYLYAAKDQINVLKGVFNRGHIKSYSLTILSNRHIKM